jgi:moderate conductance mechanosensitive channel
MLLTAPPDGDAGLTDACGEKPGAVCEAVWDATNSEGWAKAADWFIGRPLTILIILVVAWIVSRLARRAVRKAIHRVMESNVNATSWALQRVGVEPTGPSVTDPRREGRAAAIATVLASTVTVIVWVIALIMVLGELDVDLAPLIAGAGIAGVALGFGAQSLVKDCITGLFMLIEDQYGIGDDVDLGEAAGTVDRITLRTTVLRGADGTLWHVPNGQVVRVGNRSALWTVAMLDIVVGPGADVELASRIVSETATRVCESDPFAGDVLEAPELLGVESITAEGVTLRLRIKTRPGAQFAIQRTLREAIKDALDAAGVPPPRLPWAPRQPGT